MRYNNVFIVDAIAQIQRLLSILTIAHSEVANKDDIMCTIQDFVMPKLSEIKELLQVKEED